MPEPETAPKFVCTVADMLVPRRLTHEERCAQIILQHRRKPANAIPDDRSTEAEETPSPNLERETVLVSPRLMAHLSGTVWRTQDSVEQDEDDEREPTPKAKGGNGNGADHAGPEDAPRASKAEGAPYEGPDDAGHYEPRGAPASDSGARGTRFTLTPLSEIRMSLVQSYVVKGLIPKPSIVIVWGKPKSGKTFWVLDVLIHVAAGRRYRGRRVKQHRVVYCLLEGKTGFAKRIEAIRQYVLQGRDDLPFSLMNTPLKLVRDHARLIADIRKQLGDEVPGVVAIDTLNRSIDGSENDDKDVSAYLDAAAAIASAFACAVVIIHHGGHSSDHPRGHSSMMGNSDVIVNVAKTENGTAKAKVDFSKDEPSGDEFEFRLRSVDLGLDDEGDQVVSCIVEAIETLSEPLSEEKKAERADADWLLLKAIAGRPGLSLREYGEAIGKTKSFVERAVERLAKESLVERVLEKLSVTRKGEKHIKTRQNAPSEPEK